MIMNNDNENVYKNTEAREEIKFSPLVCIRNPR